MATFPKALAAELDILRPGDFDAATNEALYELQGRNIVATHGLTEHFAGLLAVASVDADVLEYCPNEPNRFATSNRATTWQAKGRALFTLAELLDHDEPLVAADLTIADAGDLRVLAYGWSGRERNVHIPGADITTAYRTMEYARRQGLSRPLVKVVVGATVALYDVEPEEVSLETWESNFAIHTYEATGFRKAGDEVGVRPTLADPGEVINGYTVYRDNATGVNVVRDTRWFMQYDLPQAETA